MDVWFCESRNHCREANSAGCGILQARGARSRERAGGQLRFPLTKTYMEVGNTEVNSETALVSTSRMNKDRSNDLCSGALLQRIVFS
jgi:hypothetical protein